MKKVFQPSCIVYRECVVSFEFKLSNSGPLTACFECSAEAIVQFSTENKFFCDFVDFAVLFTGMFV